jgi:hypothetical protein
VQAGVQAQAPTTGKDGTTVRATDFGLQADGTTDDGPAIERMLQAVASVTSPVTIVFPEKRTIRVTTARQRYVLRLHRVRDMTVEGGGSTFLLEPQVRFLRLTESNHVVIRSLNVDFAPLPFADGTIVAVNPTERFVDVRLRSSPVPDSHAAKPVGGPTRADGEQAFFGMTWNPGTHGLLSIHYWIERMEPLPREEADNTASPQFIRAYAGPSFGRFHEIEPGRSQISLPIPGIAHRFGPGACFELWDNDSVLVEDVELWSAPWFGFRVFRNRGEVVFRRVHIRPKPQTGRLTSTWRDGFHVKGNSASLLWEDCILSGMNDDAYNISNHCSRVQKVLSPRTIVVQQTYPLNIMPWHEGETLAAADFDAGTWLGESRITQVAHSITQRTIGDRPAASPVTLQLERPIPGLKPAAMVWEPAFANPKTTLRRCRIEKSCRFQSAVTLESCDVTAFLWFYCERREGPFPSNVVVRDCTIRRGRGNPNLALSFRGRREGQTGPAAVHDVVLERNKIWGGFSMTGVDNVRIEDNDFREVGATLHLKDNRSMEWDGNQDADGAPLAPGIEQHNRKDRQDGS